MVKRVTKIGNSCAILLDRSIMETAGLEEGQQVQLTVKNGCIIIAPVNPKCAKDKTFRKAMKDVLRSNESVLRKLAE
jgi:antitoxin component of MazEF toxin-antitoxin module